MSNGNTQQGPTGQQQLQTYAKKRAEVDLSIDVVILLVGGVFFLLSGLLLFPISTGALPYSKDSMYGLFVVLISKNVDEDSRNTAAPDRCLQRSECC
jgi:hypothetical protein